MRHARAYRNGTPGDESRAKGCARVRVCTSGMTREEAVSAEWRSSEDLVELPSLEAIFFTISSKILRIWDVTSSFSRVQNSTPWLEIAKVNPKTST